MHLISKLETAALPKRIPWRNQLLLSAGDDWEDPDYSLQCSSQQSTSGVCHCSMLCTKSSAQKQLTVKTPLELKFRVFAITPSEWQKPFMQGKERLDLAHGLESGDPCAWHKIGWVPNVGEQGLRSTCWSHHAFQFPLLIHTYIKWVATHLCQNSDEVSVQVNSLIKGQKDSLIGSKNKRTRINHHKWNGNTCNTLEHISVSFGNLGCPSLTNTRGPMSENKKEFIYGEN